MFVDAMKQNIFQRVGLLKITLAEIEDGLMHKGSHRFTAFTIIIVIYHRYSDDLF